MDSSEDVDVSNLSLEEKLVHKVWKVRLTSWEEVLKIVNSCPYADDPNYSKYGRFIKNGI
jgi:hypothetical protein